MHIKVVIKIRTISESRRFAKKIMAHRAVNNLLIFLIVLYVILIFANVAISDLLTEEELHELDWLLWIELSILILF